MATDQTIAHKVNMDEPKHKMCLLSGFIKWKQQEAKVTRDKQGNGSRNRNGDKISVAAGLHATYRVALISVKTPEMVTPETFSTWSAHKLKYNALLFLNNHG